MDRVIGIVKGHRITVGDALCYSRTQLARRKTRMLLTVAARVASEAPSSRDTVCRALGKWRGSTIAGYLWRNEGRMHKEKFRMVPALFDQLVKLLSGSQLDKSSGRVAASFAATRPATLRSGHLRVAAAQAATDPPSLEFKVACCLYVFAHGGQLSLSADAASIGESTLRHWLNIFCSSIISVLKPIYMPSKPFTEEDRAAIQGQFASRRGLPNVTLACDGSHIPFKPPNKRVALDYRNYKGWFSILVVAFVDSYYRFFDLDVGYPGRAGDNTVLSRNWFMRALSQDSSKWLGPNGVVLGDSGASDGDEFFLNPYHNPTDADRCWFNFCHSSTRFFIEQTFGIWKSRFRFLLQPCNTKHKLTNLMIYASAILHNFCIVHGRDPSLVSIGMEEPESWPNFFRQYCAMLCPTCKNEKKKHCVHQASYRNNTLQQALAREKPSEFRDRMCKELWHEVCHGVNFARNRTVIQERMSQRADDSINSDSWLPASN